MPLCSTPNRHRGLNTGLHYSLLGGRITVGPDWKSVLGSLALILAPLGVYFGFIAPDNGPNNSWAVVAIVAVLGAASIATLLTTALLDPGFLPRNDDPVDTELGERPNSKEHDIRGYTVTTKWCSTCNHYRPPRCSHCAICDNCTRKFDHHCPWVGNCIGERNYRFFMAFLVVTTLLDGLVHAFCWVRLVYITQHGDMPGFGEAIKREPAAIALIAYTFFAFGFVGGLTGLHAYFITTNRTTYEHFRARYGGTGNPYNRHCPQNWIEACCTRLPKRLAENLVIPSHTNGAFEPDQAPTNGQPRPIILSSQDHMGPGDAAYESGLGDAEGSQGPQGSPFSTSQSGGEMGADSVPGGYIPSGPAFPPARQQPPPGRVLPEAGGYTSQSGLSTDDPFSTEQPSGSSLPDSPLSSGGEGRPSHRSGLPEPLAQQPATLTGSGDEYAQFQPTLRPGTVRLGQYAGVSSGAASDEDDFVNTVPFEPQLAPTGIELQGYAQAGEPRPQPGSAGAATPARPQSATQRAPSQEHLQRATSR